MLKPKRQNAEEDSCLILVLRPKGLLRQGQTCFSGTLRKLGGWAPVARKRRRGDQAGESGSEEEVRWKKTPGRFRLDSVVWFSFSPHPPGSTPRFPCGCSSPETRAWCCLASPPPSSSTPPAQCYMAHDDGKNSRLHISGFRVPALNSNWIIRHPVIFLKSPLVVD